MIRAIHAVHQPAQLGQPAHVWPTVTQSDDFGGQTYVPNSLTRPHVGRLSVFGFKIYDTQPKPKPLSFPANYYKFQIKSNKISSRYGPNPSRSYESRRYPTKSQSDLLFPFNLDGANQISALVIKPEANLNQLETDKTRTKKSDQIR